MQVFVRLVSSRTVCVDVQEPDVFTVAQLKDALEALDGVPAGLQRLACGGRHLRDACTLHQSSVTG